MKHFQSITALLLAAALTLGLCLPVFAANEGLPGISEGEAQTTDESRIWLSDSMFYDTDSRDFIYPLGETGLFIHSNAADGMITTGPVYVRNGLSTTATIRWRWRSPESTSSCPRWAARQSGSFPSR